mgnify:FL=1|jgi:hypothetical protein
MKLYIRFGSLARFQDLFDSSEYLQKVLSQTRSNVYYIDTDDVREIERMLKSRNIKFDISDK